MVLQFIRLSQKEQLWQYQLSQIPPKFVRPSCIEVGQHHQEGPRNIAEEWTPYGFPIVLIDSAPINLTGHIKIQASNVNELKQSKMELGFLNFLVHSNDRSYYEPLQSSNFQSVGSLEVSYAQISWWPCYDYAKVTDANTLKKYRGVSWINKYGIIRKGNWYNYLQNANLQNRKSVTISGTTATP